MGQSESIGDLAAAFAAAQAEMKNPAFDSENPAFKSGFASHAAIRNGVIPPLAKHGIATFQNLTLTDVGVACETVFMHKSGQWASFGPMTVPITKRDAWSVAGAATYAKRVALQAAVVVVGDADDDGAAAQESHNGGIKHTKASPKDGMDLESVDPQLKEQYAQGFINALLRGEDAKIMELHNELKTQAELYTAVSDSLSSKQRADLRAIITANTKKVA